MLKILYTNPQDWKKAEIVPIRKNRQTKNLRLVSPLPICGKIFESCFPWHIKSIWQSLASIEIVKLKQNGISGILLNITDDVLANRYQRVVLNGQASGSAGLNNGVSQGSNLVFLFLVYITDLSIYIIKS